MANSDLKIRTKDYALSVIRLFRRDAQENGSANYRTTAVEIGKSVGAQYREATASSNATRCCDVIEADNVSRTRLFY
jgi:hypothetical protein